MNVEPAASAPSASTRTTGETAPVDIGPPTPKMAASEAQGLAAKDVESLFGTVKEPLKKCLPPGKGGAVQVRVKRGADGSMAVEALPGTSLDPRQRHCALEAVSAVDLSPTGTNASAPAIPPSGFSSILTVSW